MFAPLLLVALLANADEPSSATDLPVNAEEPHPLVRAEDALLALDYRAAQASLETAYTSPGNDRAMLLRILELRGLTAAALKDEAVANESFRVLLSLDPGHAFSSEHAPRIRELYEAVRAELAGAGPLQLAEVEGSPDTNIRLRVENDVYGIARDVRVFFVHEDWTIEVASSAVEDHAVSIPTPSLDLQGWWADLIGPHDSVLVSVGGPAALKSPPRPLTLSRFDVLVPDWKPASTQEQARVRPVREIPKVTWGLWAGAAGSLLTGTVLAVMSDSQRRSVLTAERDSMGRVIGMTQREAFAAEQSASDQSRFAAWGFAAGVGLAAAGGAVWWWDFSFNGGGAR